MTVSKNSIAQSYVHLALAIEQHIPGYVDAYFGPPEWRGQAEEAGPRPVPELLAEATRLAASLAADAQMDAQRRDFLSREVAAMQTMLRILGGEDLTFAEEVAGLYDIAPKWVSETVFEESHRVLEALLPPGDSVLERMAAHNQATELSAEEAELLLGAIRAELRRRASARFPLPAGESFELQLVRNEPWAAYNWYLGDYRSRIDVNIDRPLYVTSLVDLMAHEGYPGHHTDHALKEEKLVRERGYLEFSAALLYAPSAVLAEGIGTRAQFMVLSDEEWITWHQEELFPRAGLDHLDAERERAIDHAIRRLEQPVLGNVAFLLHDQGIGEEEAVAYMRRYALVSEKEARLLMDFLTNRLTCSYIFNYYYGGEMLDALFAARGDRDHWFARLLTEPVTPGQVRAWAEGGTS